MHMYSVLLVKAANVAPVSETLMLQQQRLASMLVGGDQQH